MQESNLYPSVTVRSAPYPLVMWPRFSRLHTIIYIHFLVTITSVILVRFSLYRHRLYGICGGAGFQDLNTWNVPSDPRKSRTQSFFWNWTGVCFFSSFVGLISAEHLIQANAADAWFPLSARPVTLCFFFFKLVLLSGKLDRSQSEWCLTYMYILGYHGCFWLRVVVAIVWEWHPECSGRW